MTRALLVASTLLVPGYVDEEEVRGIAGFLASLDPGIPYALLAFHPLFRMGDLPPTPAALARRCLLTAREAGVRNPTLGNIHLWGSPSSAGKRFLGALRQRDRQNTDKKRRQVSRRTIEQG